MIEKISQGKAVAAAQAYTSFEVSPKIRGRIVEKDGKDIKLDTGGQNIFDIRLNDEIEESDGEIVVLNRKDIETIKKSNKKGIVRVEDSEKQYYSEILKKIGVDMSEENMNAAKSLHINEVKITKENIQKYIIAKNSLREISDSLDYESAIKLSEMDIDIENESVQKIALSLAQIMNENDEVSISKLFSGKKMTTEEAESIAEKLYGSKMGKDITDIIKSLHKNGTNITKRNIERINDVFYKLDKIKDAKESTFVQTLKNKLDANISNIYNIERFVKSGEIQENEGITSNNIGEYGNVLAKKPKLTEKSLKMLEEDIALRLDEIKIESSRENINLSKEFIKRGMEVSRENIEKIENMRISLEKIVENLDVDKASQLLRSEVDIEREDIGDLAKRLSEMDIKKQDHPVKFENHGHADVESEMKNKEDTKEIAQHIEIHEKAKQAVERIKNLKDIGRDEILKLLEKGVDFKIEKIEKVLNGKSLGNPDYKTAIIDYSSIISNESEKSTIIKKAAVSIEKIANSFKHIGDIDFRAIEFNMKNKIAMSISNIEKAALSLDKNSKESNTPKVINEKVHLEQVRLNNADFSSESRMDKQIRRDIESARILLSNAAKNAGAFSKRAEMIHRAYMSVRENLSSKMVLSAARKNLEIENVDIEQVAEYVDSHMNEYQKSGKQKIRNFVDGITNIGGKIDKNIAALIKRNRPLSLGEFKAASLIDENKEQIGHKIDKAIKAMTEIKSYPGMIESAQRLETAAKKIYDTIKERPELFEFTYEELRDSVQDMEKSIDVFGDDGVVHVREKVKEIMESLSQSQRLAKENNTLQIPIYMNGQFSNLNMYFRDRKKGTGRISGEEMSVVLSIDTANLGNLNINIDVDKKNVDINMSLENQGDKHHVQKYKSILKGLLENSGYSMNKMDFYGEEDFEASEVSGRTVKTEITQTGVLDLKI